MYDYGSTIIAGFEGIARWEDHKNHWPIARQGNYVLWGFSAPMNNMTEAGKRLFVNLLINHSGGPDVPLSQALKKVNYVKPGLFSGRLTAQFTGHRRKFQVQQTGVISAKLSWGGSLPLALILNGPGQVGYYARKDGASPLVIEFNVSEEHIARGTDWQIKISTFEILGSKFIDYKLELSFP
jgi:hypothetical protein